MTDKNEFDQEELNVAFERLNQSDGLQPSAELDSLILQMAADEIQGASVEDEKSNVTDITDISFRRGQRETHKALKKKGLFPNWVMPMGLAATVLLTFGVVNRVLLSPEFDNLTNQSSYEAVSDEVIVTSAAESKVRAEKEGSGFSSFNEPATPGSVQMRRQKPENAKAKVTVNGNEMNADISFADSPVRESMVQSPPPVLDSMTMPSAVPSEGISVNADVKVTMEVPVAGFESEAEVQLGNEQQEKDLRQEQHTFLAKEKRERLTQARRTVRAEPEIQMAPVVAPAPSISNAGASVGSVTSADVEMADVSRLDDSALELESPDIEMQAEAMSSIGEADSLEEVIITGSRMQGDSNALSDKVSEVKRQVLQSVLFEHKECQVKQDCALVALACDSCDCLEPVNNEHYKTYQSEFSQSEIAEQCTNTTVECVRNYCQVQQSE